MPNNKKKSVSSIKGLDKAHPYSRKALQVQRALHRDTELTKKKADRDNHKRLAVERLLWFKFAAPDPPAEITEADVHSIIDMYINRNEDEISQIMSQLRKNRPKPGRLGILESLREKDLAEYNAGIEIPSLTDTKNVEMLKNWEGDYNAMSSIKTVRVVNSIKTIETNNDKPEAIKLIVPTETDMMTE